MASKPENTELDTNLVRLKKLLKENTEHGEDANEISTILLWIATNHPKLLKKNTKELQNVNVERLHFPKSWEYLDELIPTEALITLLKSKVCKELSSFCGYVNAEVVKHFPQKVFTVRLALGDLVDNGALLGNLRRHQEDQFDKMDQNMKVPNGRIIIHLRCGEVKPEDLTQLPDFHPEVYISHVSDDDTAWVIQAVDALQPKIYFLVPKIEAIYLRLSKLTVSGVEAIAKGLFEAGIILSNFKVSSYNINADTEIPGYEYSDEDSDEDSEKDTEKFCRMISKKYFSEDYTSVTFTDEKGMDFTDLQEFIPSDLTMILLEKFAEMMAGESPDSDRRS